MWSAIIWELVLLLNKERTPHTNPPVFHRHPSGDGVFATAATGYCSRPLPRGGASPLRHARDEAQVPAVRSEQPLRQRLRL